MSDQSVSGELEENLLSAERILGHRFHDRGLLQKALSHSSFANERGLSVLESNERLEFLGDSVIELSVSGFLYARFPSCTEGQLTKLRSAVVSRNTLSGVAVEKGIDRIVFLGRGERRGGGLRKTSILAGAFEALVGALYIDAGYEAARDFVLGSLKPRIFEIVRLGSGDYKSDLQELVVKRFGERPEYTCEHEGPPHFRVFHAYVSFAGKTFGPAAGATKKEAEKGAARIALMELEISSGSEGRDE